MYSHFLNLSPFCKKGILNFNFQKALYAYLYQLCTFTLVSHHEYLLSLANAFQFHHLCYWVVIRQWLNCYQSFSLGCFNDSPTGNLNTIPVLIDLSINKIHATDNGIPPTQSHGWPQLIFHSFLVWLLSSWWEILQRDPAYNSNKTDGTYSKSNYLGYIHFLLLHNDQISSDGNISKSNSFGYINFVFVHNDCISSEIKYIRPRYDSNKANLRDLKAATGL